MLDKSETDKSYASMVFLALIVLAVISESLISANWIMLLEASCSASSVSPNCVLTSPIAEPTFSNESTGKSTANWS